jgi:hypothetical protein
MASIPLRDEGTVRLSAKVESAHNPKVVSSNLTPATISKSCFRKVLRNERRANRHLQFIAQFAQRKSQTSSLAPSPPISLVVPQLRRVEID